MKIKIQELNKLINIVLEDYIAKYGNYIESDNDYYWFLDETSAYNLQKDPKKEMFCVGSLEDDLNSLKKLFDEDRETSIVDLNRISSLLTLLSFEADKLNRI